MDKIIVQALAFAAHKHSGQKRKDREGSPYINHPIDVMSILALEGKINDPVVLAAALLHDTLEDTETTIEELEENFGKKIASIVVELTDDQSLPRSERHKLQISKAPDYSDEARLIRLADKISNTRDASRSPPPKWSLDRLESHFEHNAKIADILREINNEMTELFTKAYESALETVKNLRQA